MRSLHPSWVHVQSSVSSGAVVLLMDEHRVIVRRHAEPARPGHLRDRTATEAADAWLLREGLTRAGSWLEHGSGYFAAIQTEGVTRGRP